MTMHSTRRAVLAGTACLPALAVIPATALASTPDIERLWHERSALLIELAECSAAQSKAEASLPAWARPGPRSMNEDGSYTSDEVGWPEIENPTPPIGQNGMMIVRPSLYDIRRAYNINPFKEHANVRAAYRKRVRQFIARMHEKRRLERASGFTAIDDHSTKLCKQLFVIEDAIERACGPGRYDALAMSTIIDISYDGAGNAAAIILQTLMPALPEYLAIEARKEIRRYAEQEAEEEAA